MSLDFIAHLTFYSEISTKMNFFDIGSASVVECLTRERGAAGSSLTGVTVLWSLSKTH